jgi:hypothetical protein
MVLEPLPLEEAALVLLHHRLLLLGGVELLGGDLLGPVVSIAHIYTVYIYMYIYTYTSYRFDIY